MPRLEVHHNKSGDQEHWTEGDDVRPVYAYVQEVEQTDEATIQEMIDVLMVDMLPPANAEAASRRNDYQARGLRRLSTGDIVSIDGRRYVLLFNSPWFTRLEDVPRCAVCGLQSTHLRVDQQHELGDREASPYSTAAQPAGWCPHVPTPARDVLRLSAPEFLTYCRVCKCGEHAPDADMRPVYSKGAHDYQPVTRMKVRLFGKYLEVPPSVREQYEAGILDGSTILRKFEVCAERGQHRSGGIRQMLPASKYRYLCADCGTWRGPAGSEAE